MNKELREIYNTLIERPEIAELFKVILSAPEERRPIMIAKAYNMLRDLPVEKGSAALAKVQHP